VTSGGHAAAHVPEQVEVGEVSAPNRYRVFPLGPTRKVPSPVVVVPTETPVGPVGLGFGGDALFAATAEAPEQAAPRRAIETRRVATKPRRAFMGRLPS
jgi:hypothetical protein